VILDHRTGRPPNRGFEAGFFSYRAARLCCFQGPSSQKREKRFSAWGYGATFRTATGGRPQKFRGRFFERAKPTERGTTGDGAFQTRGHARERTGKIPKTNGQQGKQNLYFAAEGEAAAGRFGAVFSGGSPGSKRGTHMIVWMCKTWDQKRFNGFRVVGVAARGGSRRSKALWKKTKWLGNGKSGRRGTGSPGTDEHRGGGTRERPLGLPTSRKEKTGGGTPNRTRDVKKVAVCRQQVDGAWGTRGPGPSTPGLAPLAAERFRFSNLVSGAGRID